jgi:hypothetical protein
VQNCTIIDDDHTLVNTSHYTLCVCGGQRANLGVDLAHVVVVHKTAGHGVLVEVDAHMASRMVHHEGARGARVLDKKWTACELPRSGT